MVTINQEFTFEKYGKIRQLGHEENKNIFINGNDTIYVQEKIDGANSRFFVKDGKIIFGSRACQLTSNDGEETNVSKNFKCGLNYIKSHVKINKLKEGHIYYGEICVKHTMDYDWNKIPPYLGFDIKNVKQSTYLPWPEAEHNFKEIGLPVVPIFKILSSDQIKKEKIDDAWIPVSVYAPRSNPTLQAEGVVFKNYEYQDKYNNHLFAKHVRSKFKEDNALVFGGTVKYSEDDDGKIVARFCTNARIDKNIFKLIDEGNKLDLSLMSLLPGIVIKDIYSEHWEELLYSNMKLDLRHIRELIVRRCLSVLKQVLVNNSLTLNV